MKKLTTLLALALVLALPMLAIAQDAPTAPKLTNNPSLDVVVTNPRPVLSFFNAQGGQAPLTYEMQLCPSPEFSGPGLLSYQGLAQEPGRVSAKRVAKGDELKDKSRYWWRVRAVDAGGPQGPLGPDPLFRGHRQRRPLHGPGPGLPRADTGLQRLQSRKRLRPGRSRPEHLLAIRPLPRGRPMADPGPGANQDHQPHLDALGHKRQKRLAQGLRLADQRGRGEPGKTCPAASSP